LIIEERLPKEGKQMDDSLQKIKALYPEDMEAEQSEIIIFTTEVTG